MDNASPVLPIATRYLRSVHLQRDFARHNAALRGYLCTPLVIETTQRIIADLQEPTANHAFSIIGPYGAGKSAYGLFLAHYLASSPAQRSDLLEQYGPDEPYEFALTEAPRMHPVVLTGNSEPLRLALLRALIVSLQSHARRPETEIVNLLTELEARSTDGEIDPQTVAQFYSRASEIVRQNEIADGLLLVIDELGQYLDYSSHAQDTRDLYVLQTLAEIAANSDPVRLVIVTILHQAFDRYTGAAGEVRRTEWSKVQGRYIELPFQEPTSQVLRMIGRVLSGRGPGKRDSFKKVRREWAAQIAPISDEQLHLRPSDISTDEWEELLAQTYPLHPTVLVALPVLFRQLAQNERSLFAFLTGQEPHSLQDVVTQRGVSDPTYRLPDLYAYVEATMGMSLFTHSRGKRWAELAEVLTHTEGLPPHAHQLLITIGTLNALGQQKHLRASEALLAFALHDAIEHPDIVADIEHLTAQKQIVYRRYRDTYLIWEGSDFDIESALHQARQVVAQQRDLAVLLREYHNPTPLVARQHSYQTGAVRHFAVQYVNADQLSRSALRPSGGADGLLLYIVANDDEAYTRAEAWLNSPERFHDQEVVSVLPGTRVALHDVLLDVAALFRTLQQNSEISNDLVAQREVASRLLEAQQVFEMELGRAYGPGTSRWFWSGMQQPIATVSDIDALLSRVFDTVFSQTPRIWNELIVRRQLSSAVAKARRNLLQAMLEHRNEERLGIHDYSPERSIYETVLHKSGLHQPDERGGWRFGAPLPEAAHMNLRPAWNAIEAFFERTERERLPLMDLFSMLEKPPYGVKAGLHPLLFTCAYLVSPGEIALYERGNYLVEPEIAEFERILRQPDNFSVRRTRVDGMRALIYQRLARTFVPHILKNVETIAVLEAVNPLLLIAHKLPEYTKATQRVTPLAQRIRGILLAAPSPDDLLFRRLPAACGVEPFEAYDVQDQDRENQFFDALRTGLDELYQAYSQLLQEILGWLGSAFAISDVTIQTVQTVLVQRWLAIASIVNDNELRSFGGRLMSESTGVTWVEQVAEVVARKPAKNWQDGEIAIFQARLVTLAQRFQEYENLVVHQTAPPDHPGQLIRIGLMQNGLGDLSTVLYRNGQQNQHMELIKSRVQELFNSADPVLTAEQQLLVVADLLKPLLERIQEGENHE